MPSNTEIESAVLEPSLLEQLKELKDHERFGLLAASQLFLQSGGSGIFSADARRRAYHVSLSSRVSELWDEASDEEKELLDILAICIASAKKHADDLVELVEEESQENQITFWSDSTNYTETEARV